jgi:hypothetical protein
MVPDPTIFSSAKRTPRFPEPYTLNPEKAKLSCPLAGKVMTQNKPDAVAGEVDKALPSLSSTPEHGVAPIVKVTRASAGVC